MGAICASVQPTALEKPNSTYSPNEKVESNNKNRQETGLGGGSVFEVRWYQIDVKNHIKRQFYKHIIYIQLTPQIPAQTVKSSVYKKKDTDFNFISGLRFEIILTPICKHPY